MFFCTSSLYSLYEMKRNTPWDDIRVMFIFQIIESFRFAQRMILGWLITISFVIHRSSQFDNTKRISQPFVVRTQRLIFYRRRSHLSCKSKAPHCHLGEMLYNLIYIHQTRNSVFCATMQHNFMQKDIESNYSTKNFPRKINLLILGSTHDTLLFNLTFMLQHNTLISL